MNEWSGVGNHLDFAFRGYDSRTGRFISQDPLHNKYPWNGDYTFAEDRVIDGADLEGKEWRSVNTDNVTKLTLTVNVINANKVYTPAQIEAYKAALKPAFANEFSRTIDGHVYLAEIVFSTPEETKARLKADDDKIVNFIIKKQVAENVGSGTNGGGSYAGETAGLFKGGSQSNTVTAYTTLNGGFLVDSKVSDPQSEIQSLKAAIHNTLHGFGHTGGLPNPWQSGSPADIFQPADKKMISKELGSRIWNNLMNSDENPIGKLQNAKGSDITDGQIQQIANTVEQEQPKLNTGSGAIMPEQNSPSTPQNKLIYETFYYCNSLFLYNFFRPKNYKRMG